MTTNLTRYETDLERLINEGVLLLTAMQYDLQKENVTKQIKESLRDKAEAYIKALPDFNTKYQAWYSEAKSVIKQTLPDRLSDFVRHYERQQNRKMLQWDNYSLEDYLQGLSRGDIVPKRAGLSRMEQQLRILEAAKQRFKSSLFDIRQLVAADIFDSEIASASALLKAKFLRAAGAVAGVVMEKHLAQVCENHSIKIPKKNPTIGDLNDFLKNSDVIDTPRWRANQHLADIRNLCDHSRSNEPTADQVQELIDGVAKILKTLF